MPPHENDDLSLLRALADDFILNVAEQDPARVIKALVKVCARLAAERRIATQELQTAVETLLLEWHEQSPDQQSDLTERGDRVPAENGCALVELERQKIRARDLAHAILHTAVQLSQKTKRPGSRGT